MKPLYLSSVRISDFRTYGQFELNLPEGPSLTVVCGMNGLGKTTFFDAIEWGLLGDIQRFHGQHLSTASSPLTRREAPKNSHRVELRWGDHAFVRTHEIDPDPVELTRLLQNADWRARVQKLDVYLRLTHFLPQSSRQRFLNQGEKDRWTLLKGPTGVDRLERFREMLNDIKARNAFDRRRTALELIAKDTDRQRVEWLDLLAQQKRWSELVVAGAGNSPQQVTQILDEVTTHLALRSPVRHVDVAKRLIQVRDAVIERGEHCAARLRDLSLHERTIGRYAELGQQVEALRLSTTAFEAELQKIRDQRTEFDQKAMALRQRLNELDAKRNASNAKAISLLAALEALDARTAIQRRLTATDDQKTVVAAELANIQRERAAHQQSFKVHEDALRAATTLRERAATLEHVEKMRADVVTQERQREALGREIAELDGKRLPLLEIKARLEAEAIELDKRREELTARLAAERLTLDAMGQARTTVVEGLTPDDRICPICGDEHPAGQLVQRAQALLRTRAQQSSAVLEQLAKVDQQRETVRRRQSGLREDFAAIDATIKARREVLTSSTLMETLLTHPLLVGTELGAIPDKLLDLRQALAGQEQEIRERVVSTQPSEEAIAIARNLEERENRASQSLRQIETEQNTVTRLLEDAEQKIRVVAQLISESGGPAEVQGLRNQLLREIARLDGEAAPLRQNLTNIEAQISAADRLLAERTAQGKADEQARNARESERKALLTAWRKANLADQPDQLVLNEARSQQEQSRNTLLDIQQRLQKAAEGLEAWNSHQELARVNQTLAEIRNREKAVDDADCTRRLTHAAANATSAVQRAVVARKRAEEIAHTLRHRSVEFSKSALQPLSTRVSAFHRLLSPFPYDITLKPHLTAATGKARTTLAVPNLTGNKTSDEDPELWLSEGQAAALGVSVLLAASTVYRWSRWPALLLDDPLQNNDLIHAAAFGDVIRGLMQEEGYQVIVSTHDQDEADYLIRKVRRAGLPVQRLELTSLHLEGVRYELREN